MLPGKIARPFQDVSGPFRPVQAGSGRFRPVQVGAVAVPCRYIRTVTSRMAGMPSRPA
jgi:hypothetical protein